jgi:phosphoglycerate kinase
MAQAIASSGAFSVVGGGETIEAVERFGLAEQFSYLSTAGGAFLEYLEGRTLPGVAVLEERAAP